MTMMFVLLLLSLVVDVAYCHKVIRWSSSIDPALEFEGDYPDEIFSSRGAFVGRKNEQGDYFCWGELGVGGDCSGVDFLSGGGVKQIVGNDLGFAAVMNDGSVQTWPIGQRYGEDENNAGGTSSTVDLTNVDRMYSNAWSFVAVKESNDDLVCYGEPYGGGDSSEVTFSKEIREISSNRYAHVALFMDGTMKCWGHEQFGGKGCLDIVENVDFIVGSEGGAFAARTTLGGVITWGNPHAGGDSSTVSFELKNIENIYSTYDAFAAVKRDGSVVVWGDPVSGGLFDENMIEPVENIEEIYSNSYAFVAVQSGRQKIFCWGDKQYGGTGCPTTTLPVPIKQIVPNNFAFAVALEDHTVFTFGADYYGGDSSTVASRLINIDEVFANNWAFVAVKFDRRSVVAWGDQQSGGNVDSFSVGTGLIESIVPGGASFSALVFPDDGRATKFPTDMPSTSPTLSPSTTPTTRPTQAPTTVPSKNPTEAPSESPSYSPSSSPTTFPTMLPTDGPTTNPSKSPSSTPTTSPTASPTTFPTMLPTDGPTTNPSNSPSSTPTTSPTASPTTFPTMLPTDGPTSSPSGVPTGFPTMQPTNAPNPV